MHINQKPLKGPVLALGLFVCGSAMAAMEVESNNTIGSAQYLSLPSGSIVLPAELGGAGGNLDVDLFQFSGRAGDVVTIDIDNGIGGTKDVDTILGVFGPGPDYALLRTNDDTDSLDPGSTSNKDARIDNFVLPATGVYYVGVSSAPRYFWATGGGVNNRVAGETISLGDYDLAITGVSPATVQISLDIRPGSKELVRINPKSNAKLPVAILSSTDFDATSIDPASLKFGASGYEDSLAKCNPVGQDLNADGRLDLLCHFEVKSMKLGEGDLEGILRGSANGVAFEGRGFLKIIP